MNRNKTNAIAIANANASRANERSAGSGQAQLLCDWPLADTDGKRVELGGSGSESERASELPVRAGRNKQRASQTEHKNLRGSQIGNRKSGIGNWQSASISGEKAAATKCNYLNPYRDAIKFVLDGRVRA